MSGFGGDVEVEWPGPSFPAVSSAVPRTELDDRIRMVAADDGAKMLLGAKAIDVRHDSAGRVSSLVLDSGAEIGCTSLIVADGARSPLGRALGRQWHQETVYGVAIRGYIATPRHNEPWITSHLELRSPEGKVLPGYGWIFPLGDGEVNIGVGALATTKRPADAALRPLMSYYTSLRREEWGFSGEPRAGLSALLPMGGAVSGVAGPNWMLIGDAAACVNPAERRGHRLRAGDGPAGSRAAGHRRPVVGMARGPLGALRAGVLGCATAGATADDSTVPAVDGAYRDAVEIPDEHRGAGDGQPRHR